MILLFRSMVVLKVGAGFLFNLILNNAGISLSPLLCVVVALMNQVPLVKVKLLAIVHCCKKNTKQPQRMIFKCLTLKSFV